MDAMLAVQMLRVSLPDEGSSHSLDEDKLLSIIADAFSRERELREVFVCMVSHHYCERLYAQRKTKNFAACVRDNMNSFGNDNTYARDVIHEAFTLWAKAVCPTYQELENYIANPPINNRNSLPKTNVPITIVSKYQPPKAKPQHKHQSKVWCIVVIALITLLGLALIGWLWMQFSVARIIICIVAVIVLFGGLIIFSEA